MMEGTILSEERIAHYIALELAGEEYNKPEKDRRLWVLGALVYRDRIEEILGSCLAICQGNCLEIGCYGGATTARMVRVAREYGRVVLGVDPYTGRTDYWKENLPLTHKEFLRTTESWREEGLLKFLKDYSQSEEARCFVEDYAPYSFVFVDGDHNYDEVLADLRLVMPLTNGIICLDDWFLRSVKDATATALAEFPSWHVALEIEEFAEVYLAVQRV